jgi:hypothetical protein
VGIGNPAGIVLGLTVAVNVTGWPYTGEAGDTATTGIASALTTWL